MKTLSAAIAALTVTAGALLAQSPAMSCRNRNTGFCEIRESTIPASANLNVNGNQNGGISVRGANRTDILVRAMVQAQGTGIDARNTAAQVILHTSGGAILADGPARKSWSVSYEIFVPAATNLSLSANNGGVSVIGVNSSIEIHTQNGGISLKDVNGSVRGTTQNGGITATFADAKLTGQGMDLTTTNGGVSVTVPEKFSALLDVATVNGGLSVPMPEAQLRRADHTISMTLGSGGPLIHIRTQNGGISISRPTV